MSLIVDFSKQFFCKDIREQANEKGKTQHRLDTTELYLNLIQVHCLYRVYLQDLKSGKGKNRKKQTLDTTEVLAKSIYRYVIY